MTSPTPPVRIALAAAPPLLADTLRALLAQDGADVSLVLEPTAEAFDVAIVTADTAVPVTASVRIVLDETPASRGGGTVRLARSTTIELPDLAALLAFVRDLGTGAPRVASRPER